MFRSTSSPRKSGKNSNGMNNLLVPWRASSRVSCRIRVGTPPQKNSDFEAAESELQKQFFYAQMEWHDYIFKYDEFRSQA